MPFVPIPDGPPYRIRPIHVKDYADLVVAAAASNESCTVDAVGPDRPEFSELIREVADAAGSRANAVRMPMRACRLSYAVAGRILGETVLSDDELTGLSRNRLDSKAESTGSTSLLDWVRASSQELGRCFRREPGRPWR
jgi:nucleoside-diphosphate-sugar epimerase